MYRSTTASVQSSPAQAGFQPQACQPPQVITLTAREKEVLQWGLAGKSSWETAQICGCSHYCNIRRKFGVRTRWAAMAKALEQGLIHPS